jgi:UPF0755 protein
MSTEQPSGFDYRKLLLRGFVVLLLLVLAGAAITLGMYQRFQATDIRLPGEELTYQLPAGASLHQLAYDLERRGIIEQPRFFILLGRELDAARRLQAGEYVLARGMRPRTLLELMVAGRVIQHELTLIEGENFREMLQRIQTHPVIEVTLNGLDDAAIMERLGHPGMHPEGRFLPDTYFFPRGTTDLAFLHRAYAALAEQLARAWEERADGLPLETPEQALTLASIVEKETGRAEERPQIAGVFVRRLQKGMKLQTDPTVIYGMGEAFDGNLRLRDLRKDTPYNTYTRYGLPPTPIAMPGSDAIRAVLNPAAGDSLYFVSMGDGRHYFSSSLKEHNLAVDKFQRGKQGIELPAKGTPE